MDQRTTRRRFLMTAGLSALVAPTRVVGARGHVQASPNSADGVEARAAAVLRAYDAQGIHRTATDVDRVSAEWLREAATAAGGRATLEPFSLKRLDIGAAFVEVDGQRITGLPFFDGTETDANGVSGTFVAGSLHLATADRAAVGTEGLFVEAARTSSRAVVVVTAGERPGLVPSNARRFAQPFGCPVLQVPSDADGTLQRAQRSGATVRVVCHGVRTPATAFNVVVDVPGREPTRAPVVVITPRSGWWQCAAERGGGIACWLETIRAAAAAAPTRPLRFIASSGHELGHLGLDAFLHTNDALVRGAHAWVHLGANIGASAGDAPPVGVRLQSSHDELETVLATALTTSAATIADRLPRGRVPAGEARNLHVGGGRYVSLVGQGNPWFHHADDRYPKTVNETVVARYARGVSAAVVALARS